MEFLVRTPLSLLLALLPLASQAATEFTDNVVPLELVREFNPGNYYSSLPDDFPVRDLQLGLGLRVIGSIVRGQSSQDVLLRTTSSADTAKSSLIDQLASSGWLLVSENTQYSTLCHDEHGSIRLRTADFAPGDNRVYASLSRTPQGYPFAQTCAQMQATANDPLGRYGPLYDLMPVLEVPETATTPDLSAGGISAFGIFRSGGFGISGNGSFEFDRSGNVAVPDFSAALLYEHFAVQMREQGWTEDSGATGTRSASATWFREVAAPEGLPNAGETIELIGKLQLLDLQEDTYRVDFVLQSISSTPLITPSLGIRGIAPF
jgi:hypothetical protein